LGVFPGGILIPHLPANLRLAIYLEATLTEDYKGPIFLRMLCNDAEVMQIKGELDSKVGGVALPLASFIAGFTQPGRIDIEVSLDGASWAHLLSRDLIVAPPAA
jgi:hypothetical protein